MFFVNFAYGFCVSVCVCVFVGVSYPYSAKNYFVNHFFQERQAKEIVLKAMGQAINKAVASAEILKVATI